MKLNKLTVSQVDELGELRCLVRAVEMAIFGSVSLDPLEHAALNSIASLVSNRMAALVDAINEHEDELCKSEAAPNAPE